MCQYRYIYFSHCKHESFVLFDYCEDAKPKATTCSPTRHQTRVKTQSITDARQHHQDRKTREQSSTQAIDREAGADVRGSVERPGLNTSSHRNVSTCALAQADKFCLPERSADNGLDLESQHTFPPLSQTVWPASPASAAITGRRASWAQVAGLTSMKNTNEFSDADTVSTTITSGCSMSIESSKTGSDLMAAPGDIYDFHPYLTTKSHSRAASRSPRKIVPEEWTRAPQVGELKKKISPVKATRAHGPILATAQRAAAREEHHKIAPSTRDSCNKVKPMRRKIMSLGEDSVQPPATPTRIPRLRLKMNFQRGARSKTEIRADEDAPTDEIHGSVPPIFDDSTALGSDGGESSGHAQKAVDAYKPSSGMNKLDHGAGNAEKYERIQDCQDISSADHSTADPEVNRSASFGSTVAFGSAVIDIHGTISPSTPTNDSFAEPDDLTPCDEFSTRSESDVPVGMQWAVHYGHDLARQGNVDGSDSTVIVEPHSAEMQRRQPIGQPRSDRGRQARKLDGQKDNFKSGLGSSSSSKPPFNAEAREFVPLALSTHVPFGWQTDQYSATKRENTKQTSKRKKESRTRRNSTIGKTRWETYSGGCSDSTSAPDWYDGMFRSVNGAAPTFESFYRQSGRHRFERPPIPSYDGQMRQSQPVRKASAASSVTDKPASAGKSHLNIDESAEYIGYGLRGGCGTMDVELAVEVIGAGGICSRCWPEEQGSR